MEHCHCEEQYESHDLVECIANALDARDPYTGNHSRRVSDMACMLCHYLGLSEKETQTIHIAAHLHDIGKIGIPDAILRKPARLNDYEWAVMKDHPKIGAEIIGQAAGLQEIARIILNHHERYDGRGYPRRLAGEEIPVMGRILCIADAFDAIISVRNYKDAISVPRAIEILRSEAGKQFDPNLVEIFAELVESGTLKLAPPKTEASVIPTETL